MFSAIACAIACLLIIGRILFVRNKYLNLKMSALICQFLMSKHLKTMTPESIVRDLTMCLNSTSNKMDKRIKRLEMCLLHFKRLPRRVVERARDAITSARSRRDDPNVANVGNQISPSAIDSLFENKHCNVFKANGLFDQPASSAKDIFNSYAKDVVNETGEVYDIASMIAIIAYYRLYSSMASFIEYDRLLIKKSSLVFKGGAAVGKFLISSNKRTKTEKEFFDTFVKGGDNDTSMSFHNVDSLSPEEIFYGIERIMESYMGHVNAVCDEYDVEAIIRPHTSKVCGALIEVAEQRFQFEDGKCQSFSIRDYAVVDGEQYKCIIGLSAPRSLYISKSLLDFVHNKARSCFYLGRVKKAFNVRNVYGDKIAVNSEILDVSLITPYSTDRAYTYQKVSPVRLF